MSPGERPLRRFVAGRLAGAARVLLPGRAVGAAALVLLGTTACGSDAPTDEPDTGIQQTELGDGCDGVAVAATLGEACETEFDCDSAAECSVLEGETIEQGLCRQTCVPGRCDAVCGEGEVCLPLTDEPRLGVCAPDPGGTRVNYETCSDDVGACVDGLSCLVASDGAAEGVCLQPCDEGLPCPTYQGGRARCVIEVGTADGLRRFCAPECPEPGEDAACPGAMTCEAAGVLAVCAFGAS